MLVKRFTKRKDFSVIKGEFLYCYFVHRSDEQSYNYVSMNYQLRTTKYVCPGLDIQLSD